MSDCEFPGLSGLSGTRKVGTVSLGICTVCVLIRPDLRAGPSVSDRGEPLLAPANGTPMARLAVCFRV